MVDASGRDDVRVRIVDVAARLLQTDGPAAVTTRGVAQAAGVQAPAIYRLFGDKDGLLEAVAEHVMAMHVALKREAVEAGAHADTDPVEDLRSSWILQIEFGTANPAIFRLLSEPGRVSRSPSARAGRRVLETRIQRIAAAGRLGVGERRAVDLVQAAGIGTIQTLLTQDERERDPDLPETMLDAVLGRILTDAPQHRDVTPVTTAVALKALAPGLDALTEGERGLLVEWLDRAIAAG